MNGIDLMLMPGYYHDYLEQKYPGEFPDPQAAFRSVDGVTNFPELILLMRQIQTFQGTGISAHLFYESKVAEALSLIIEKTVWLHDHRIHSEQADLSRRVSADRHGFPHQTDRAGSRLSSSRPFLRSVQKNHRIISGRISPADEKEVICS